MRARASATSSLTSLSLLMSILAPISSEARRTFWPRLPMASESCSSSTMTSRCGTSPWCVTETRVILAGAERALGEGHQVVADHSMMSIFSPRSSRMIDCTREPFMPTQAPTGSTSRSRL